MNDLIDNFNY